MPIQHHPREKTPLSAWLMVIIGTCALVLVLGAAFAFKLHHFQQERLNGELQAAAMQGDVAAIDRLVRQGAEVNWTEATPPLICAASEFRGDAVRKLLDLGARVDIRNRRDGTTPLQAVIDGAQMRPVAAEATARVLLESGADVTLGRGGAGGPLAWAQQVSATLKKNPEFYALANSTYDPRQLPKDAEVGRIPTKKMESSRARLVRAIIVAASR